MLDHRKKEVNKIKNDMDVNEKMDLKGTQTEKNLLAAFAGESQARNRYSYFASKAKRKGMNK